MALAFVSEKTLQLSGDVKVTGVALQYAQPVSILTLSFNLSARSLSFGLPAMAKDG
jgi:hypothetical protein